MPPSSERSVEEKTLGRWKEASGEIKTAAAATAAAFVSSFSVVSAELPENPKRDGKDSVIAETGSG